MKIATVIGIFALAGATTLGCSGASSSGSGFGTDNNASGDDDASSGNGSDDSTGSSGGSSGASSGSSNNSSSGSNNSSSGGSSSGSSKPPVTTGGDGGVMTTVGGDGGGAADNDETDDSLTKTINMDPFPVPAGTEVFYCQNFKNPWGKQTDIKTYDLTMDTGSHHMFAFYAPNATDGAAAPCAGGGLTYAPFTFTSQSPKVTETYPATVGATIPATTGFQLMAHYVNTGSTTLTAHVTLTMYGAKAGLVTNHVGVIFDNQAGMKVPAGSVNYASTQSLAIGQEVYILSASSHMHKFASKFTATATVPGQSPITLYETTEWDEPVSKVYDPPLHIPNGASITWTCIDTNPSSTTALTFGEYANTNVMCIDVNIFYPVSNINNPTIGSPIGGF